MDIRTYIKDSRNKTFTLTQLMQASGVKNEEELFRIITACTDSGDIEPVRASGTNGNRKYPL
ncbi:MAG: hypothetical protein Q4F95_05270 [Oscillospiraceae bacterium]|nr:hypothetical protein [Oscillospiraceae bacterium]